MHWATSLHFWHLLKWKCHSTIAPCASAASNWHMTGCIRCVLHLDTWSHQRQSTWDKLQSSLFIIFQQSTYCQWYKSERWNFEINQNLCVCNVHHQLWWRLYVYTFWLGVFLYPWSFIIKQWLTVVDVYMSMLGGFGKLHYSNYSIIKIYICRKFRCYLFSYWF